MKRALRTALLAGAASLALAAPAAADSIVYVKDHNLWLAQPDGSGQYQVTLDGTSARPYRSPSQADDGTIVAGHGMEIVRMRQNGEVLSRFDPPAATDSTGAPIDEVPQDVSVSPDGSRIAFVYHRSSCPPGAPCGARQVLLYSHADRATPVSVFGQHTNRRNPSWSSNDSLLMFGGAGSHVNLDSPGGGNDDAQHWFDDDAMEDLDDGELSRQGDRLAMLRSYGSNTHLAIYSVGQPGGAPAQAACYSGTDASLAGPSWSPDGRAVAFAHSEGIEVLALPAVVPGDCPGAGSGRVVIAGGAEPDWGPADVSPGPRPGSPTGAGAPAPAAAEGLAVRAARTSLRRALSRGVKLAVRPGAAGRASAKALLGRTTVASGATSVGAGGTASLTLRFSAKGKRLLRARRAASLRVRVTFKPSAGGAVRTRTLRLKLGR